MLGAFPLLPRFRGRDKLLVSTKKLPFVARYIPRLVLVKRKKQALFKDSTGLGGTVKVGLGERGGANARRAAGASEAFIRGISSGVWQAVRG